MFISVSDEHRLKHIWEKYFKGSLPAAMCSNEMANFIMQLLIAFLIENEIIEAKTIEPIELFVRESRVLGLLEEAAGLESLELNETGVQWLQVFSEGWATPMRRFMREKEYLSCPHFSSIFENGRLHNQSIPIVLPINIEQHSNAIDCYSLIQLLNRSLTARSCSAQVPQQIGRISSAD